MCAIACILHEDYGDECVQQLRGMCAFALRDVNRKRLVLARDRAGVKTALLCSLPRPLLLSYPLLHHLRALDDYLTTNPVGGAGGPVFRVLGPMTVASARG